MAKESPKQKKALMLASVASMIEFFNAENLKILQNFGYKVEVATNFEQGSISNQDRVDKYRKKLESDGIKTYQVPIPRSPSKIGDFFKSKKILKQIAKDGQYDLVHCHSPLGSILCRMVWAKYRKHGCRVLYTAHGFHFFKGAPLINWLLYYPPEWWYSFKTDVLITMNKEDYERAKKRLHAKRTEYVPGIGIDVDKFTNAKCDKAALRKEIGVPENAFMILSVGELNKNKNHQIVIRAIGEIDDEKIYYCIAGKGDLEVELNKLADKVGVCERLKLLGFRDDVEKLYKCADLIVHPSYREGLPVAVMEGLASGTPVVTSDIRGSRDLVKNVNRFTPSNIEKLKNLIMLYLTNTNKASCNNILKLVSSDNVNSMYKMIYNL